MQLVAPDLVAEARGFPPAVLGTALAVGLFLWILGARSHRFWIALIITLGAGLVGLSHGPAYGMQPLVAGLLLAVAAGALALSLVRVLLFAAGGLTALAVMHSLLPAYDEPLVSFLVGGLGGILLYRFWITTLTSLIGTLLIAYSTLCLLDGWRVLDAVNYSRQNALLLNGGCGAATVVGVLLQFLLERQRRRKARALAQEAEDDDEDERLSLRARGRRRSSLWGWMQKQSQRRAG
jgi:MFS family permease